MEDNDFLEEGDNIYGLVCFAKTRCCQSASCKTCICFNRRTRSKA